MGIENKKLGLPEEYFGIWKDKDTSFIEKRRKEIDKECEERKRIISKLFH